MQAITEQSRHRPTNPADFIESQDNKFKNVTEIVSARFSPFLSAGDMRTLSSTSKDLKSYLLPKFIDYVVAEAKNTGLGTDAADKVYRAAIDLGVKPSDLKSTQRLLIDNFVKTPSDPGYDDRRRLFTGIMNALVTRVGLDGNESIDESYLPSTEGTNWNPSEKDGDDWPQSSIKSGYNASVSINQALDLAKDGCFDDASLEVNTYRHYIPGDSLLDSNSCKKIDATKRLIEVGTNGPPISDEASVASIPSGEDMSVDIDPNGTSSGREARQYCVIS